MKIEKVTAKAGFSAILPCYNARRNAVFLEKSDAKCYYVLCHRRYARSGIIPIKRRQAALSAALLRLNCLTVIYHIYYCDVVIIYVGNIH